MSVLSSGSAACLVTRPITSSTVASDANVNTRPNSRSSRDPGDGTAAVSCSRGPESGAASVCNVTPPVWVSQDGPVPECDTHDRLTGPSVHRASAPPDAPSVVRSDYFV